MKMKKIVFSSVCALALCGTNVFANAAALESDVASGGVSTFAALSGNDAFLGWELPKVDSVEAKYKELATKDYWAALGTEEGTKIAGLFDTLKEKADLAAAAKTALGVKGDDGSLTSGIYKDIETNSNTITTNQASFDALKAVATEVESKKVAELDTYFDGLVGGSGSLTTGKTEAERALKEAQDVLGVQKDGDAIAKSTGLQLAKEVNNTIAALTEETKAFITSSIELGAAADNSDGLAEGDTIFGKLNKAIKDAASEEVKKQNLEKDLEELKKIVDSVAALKTATSEGGVLKDKQAELTLDKLKTDVVGAMITEQEKIVSEKEITKTEATDKFNAVNDNRQAAKDYLTAKETLGEENGTTPDSLYAKKKTQEGIIQAAEDAKEALDTAIKATDAYKNAGATTEPGEGENSGAGGAGSGQEGENGDGNTEESGNNGENGEGNNQGGNQEPSEPNEPEETEAEMVAAVDEFLGAELSKGVSKAAKVELYNAIGKLNGKAFNEQTAEVKAEVKKAVDSFATKVVESKKEDIMASASSATLVQLNNMTKRLGEVRDMNADYGLWLRNYGGRMSTDNNHLNYYSVQLGADKVNTIGDDRLITGLLTGFDKINGDVKSKTYSVGGYVSYLHNSGVFGDVVLKYANTKHERDAHEFKKQNSFLASFEGGYRFSATDSFYVEPSLELITGHIGKYEDKNGVNTISIDSHTPFIIKPQAFVGGMVDSFTYRAGIGGVFNTTSQEAKISMDFDEVSKGLKADGKTKLDKNNHGFVSLGGSYKVGDNLRFNLGVERSFGGKITNDYELNATIRYGF